MTKAAPAMRLVRRSAIAGALAAGAAVTGAAWAQIEPAAGGVNGPPAQSELPRGLGEVAAQRDLNQCVNHAATYHQVNPWILAAILRHESGLMADAVRRNSNGSLDVGICQVNSIHWPRMASFGIAPADLLNPCVCTFVAGWLLGGHTRRWGNTWWAVGAYHSVTPAHNARYQIAIWNQLVGMGVVPGPKLADGRAP